MVKTSTPKKTVFGADPALNSRRPLAVPSASDVAVHAYDLYLARGCQPGHDVEDWLQAERELRGSTVSSRTSRA